MRPLFQLIENLSLKKSILFSFILIIFVNLGSDLFTLRNMDLLKDRVMMMYDKVLMTGTFAQSAKYNYSQFDSLIVNAILSENLEQLEERHEEAQEALETFAEDLDVVLERSMTEKGRTLTQEIEEKLPSIESKVEGFIERAKSNLKLKGFKRIKSNVDLVKEWNTDEIGVFIRDNLNNLSEHAAVNGYEFRSLSEKENTFAVQVTMGLILAVVLLSICISLLLSRIVISPLLQMTGTCGEIAKGDYEKRVGITNKSEIGNLADSFNKMVGEVQKKDSETRQLLEEVASGKKDVQTLLDNLEQGFMTFGEDGVILPGWSKVSETFFGMNPEGKCFEEVLQTDGKGKNSLKDWYRMLFEEMLDFKDIALLGPSSFEKIGGRYIELEYRPIRDPESQKIKKVICIASDKTLEKKLKEEAEAQNALVQMVISILKDRSSFLDFVLETRSTLSALQTELSLDIKEVNVDSLFRWMHTIKGGAASFHLLEICKLAHGFENELANIKVEGGGRLAQFLPTLKEGVGSLHQKFEKFLVDNEPLFGKIGEDVDRTKTIDISTIHAMSSVLADKMGEESATFKKFLEDFVLEDVAAGLKKFEAVVLGVAERQMKEVAFSMPDSKLKVCLEPYLPLFSTFVHLFRNSVDHGMETPDERESEGKDPTGKIKVSFKELDSSEKATKRLRILVEDDGRGINTSKIKEKALEKKLYSKEELDSMDEKTVMQLIFENGFSTRDEVSDLSGRGVGLDAVRYEAKKLGGTAWVESQKGKGSQFYVEIPIYRTPVFRPVDIRTLSTQAS